MKRQNEYRNGNYIGSNSFSFGIINKPKPKKDSMTIWQFIIMLIESVVILAAIIGFVSNAKADVTVIIGQSNAYFIDHYSNVIGHKTGTKQINCSHPGEKIVKFMPGGKFMRNCLKQIGDQRIDNIVFWQGESDTQTLNDAGKWRLRAGIVLNTLLKTQNHKVNIVMVILNNKQDLRLFPYWNLIRDRQLRFPIVKKLDSSSYEFADWELAPWSNSPEIVNLPVHLTEDGYVDIGSDIAKILNK